MKIQARTHKMQTRSTARKIPMDSPAKISGYAAAYIFNNWTHQHNQALHDVLKQKETELSLLKERVRLLEMVQTEQAVQHNEIVRTLTAVEDDNEMYHDVLHEIFEFNPIIRWEMRNRVNFSDLPPVDPAVEMFGSDSDAASEVETVVSDQEDFERQTLEDDLQDAMERDMDEW